MSRCGPLQGHDQKAYVHEPWNSFLRDGTNAGVHVDGENITPKDIEDALMAYPSVSQAAVVGVPHEKHGESIVAFVELQSRGTVEEKSLRRWLRERKLSPYKMPDVFISIGDMEGGLKSLPINTSGKVLKTELRSFARVHAGGL